MSDFNTNPLAKHFRQPSIYIKLPSNGKFWPEGSLDLPLTGEIPVFPMTTRDEIVLRTPDALMNGSGVVEIIQSCVPNIKNAWLAPSVDIDTIFIAMRIASYGHNMDMEANCPKCSEKNLYTVDLRQALASIQCPNYDELIQSGDIKIKLKPQPYEQTNKTSALGFEEQKMIQNITDSGLNDEEKVKVIAEQMKKLVDITLNLLTESTEYVQTTDGIIVTDKNHIAEFYRNSESKITRDIQARAEVMAKEAAIKPVKVKCEKCENEYEMTINFDYASFFAVGF